MFDKGEQEIEGEIVNRRGSSFERNDEIFERDDGGCEVGE